MRGNKFDIKIDESTHRESPIILNRLKHFLLSVVMGVVVAQVMMFAFRFGVVVLFYDNIIFIS